MAEARVDLVLGNSGFLQGISQADAAQKKFANSWEANIGRIFKRSPFARAERAIEEFGILLGSGNLPGAFAALGSRITGLGLGIGVALGAGIGLFQKLRGEAKESALAVAAINRELSVPLSVQGNLGPGIASAVDRDNKLLDDLLAKRETIGGKIAEKLEKDADKPRGFLNARDLQRLGLSQDQIIDQITNKPKALQTESGRAQEAIEERISQLIQRRAQYEEQIANIKARQLIGDKFSATLEQNRLAFEQARAELTARALTDARRDAFQQLGAFTALQRSLAGLSNLKNAQDLSAQRDFFQNAVQGFTPGGAAVTEGFLREKIASLRGNMTDFELSGHPALQQRISDMQLKADQLSLFQETAKLNDLKNLSDNSILNGPGGRMSAANLDNQITAQQEKVTALSQKVAAEQAANSSNPVVQQLSIISQKMDTYWR